MRVDFGILLRKKNIIHCNYNFFRFKNRLKFNDVVDMNNLFLGMEALCVACSLPEIAFHMRILFFPHFNFRIQLKVELERLSYIYFWIKNENMATKLRITSGGKKFVFNFQKLNRIV